MHKKVYIVCQVERHQGNCRLKYKWYSKNQALYCPMQGAGTWDPNIECCCPPPPPWKQSFLQVFMAGKRVWQTWHQALLHVSHMLFLAMNIWRILGVPLWGWREGSTLLGFEGCTASSIRQYSDWLCTNYIYFTPQFPWYLLCPPLLLRSRLLLMAE